MKICAVGLRGIPDVMGGVEKHCEHLYPRMAALDADIQIQVIGRSAYLKNQTSNVRGVDVVSLWCLRNKYLEAVLHTFLAVLYARFVTRADLVHIHAIGPGLFVPLARLLGMKVIFTHHGAAYQWRKWNRFAKWILRAGESWALRWAHATIVVSASLCSNLKQRYSAHADKLIHIPNGAEAIDREASDIPSDPVLEQFGLTAGQYILAVGRLVPEKGFHDLIDAYRIANPARKLVIVGSADHPDAFSRNLLKQQQDGIVFTGFQRGNALATLYRNTALFVLPSHHEGLPIAALEAISAGCPVLLSNIEPNLDIRLPAACYFPVGNSQALADRLLAPDFAQQRVKSDSILVRYNWDSIAQHTLACLKNAEPSTAGAMRVILVQPVVTEKGHMPDKEGR
jgi:glycosyltransferase involved in cell wall biosynthesis